MITPNSFTTGVCIRVRGTPMIVEDVVVTMPIGRSGDGIAKTRLRSTHTGKVTVESFRTSDRFEEVECEEHDLEFTHTQGDSWWFLDQESHEQVRIQKEDLGGKSLFMTVGMKGLRARLVDGSTVEVLVPGTVDLVVVEAEPYIKGATALPKPKNAILETGYEARVPAHIECGDTVRIDTTDGHFVERVRKRQ